ncbi:histidine-rich glycoprotein isoform X2 [Paroedura picta]|uniref:histidine-rich glycoprotein isoform X2 n=1 Tax=Paroedura picta TaxID=143630 RepID=UPI0040562149
MELLPAFVFCAILLCSNAQSLPPVDSADCKEVEKEAGVALDLINKHRKDGYVFSLLRVADAHVQQAENAFIFYFILDVLETDCPVISRKHWETCGYEPLLGTSDFGRCNAVIYVDRALQRYRLYGYNCTMSPVPPKFYECHECDQRIKVLEDVKGFAADAKRILELYGQKNNETDHFKVHQVTKVLLVEARGHAEEEAGSYTVHRVEFTIKKARTDILAFLHGTQARTGFCRGKVLSGTSGLEGVEAESCEIYDVPTQLEKHPFHTRPHNDSGEHHHHCNVSRRGCKDSWHRHHHHDHHHRPNDRQSCHINFPPLPHLPHHHHHHRRPSHHNRRPPHTPHHHHHHIQHHHGHRDCPVSPVDHSNSSKESQGKDYPGFPPLPGPHHPPPPPGGPHHIPPGQPCPPLAGSPPPSGQPFPSSPHPHHQEESNFHPSQRCPCGPRRRHHHDHRWNNTHGRREDPSSKDHHSFQSPHSFLEGEVHRIPLANEHDVLQAPGADFFPPPHDKFETAVIQPFPLTPSKSQSCPGNPTFKLPFDLLSLYPRPPMH